jgi:rhodanese-related sulfurtransferase
MTRNSAEHRVTMDEVAQRISFSSGSLVLDVRTGAEFMRGHVPGALNAPLSDVERSPGGRAQVRAGATRP